MYFTATDNDVLLPTFVLFWVSNPLASDNYTLASGNWTPGVETEVTWDPCGTNPGEQVFNLTVYDGLGLSTSVS